MCVCVCMYVCVIVAVFPGHGPRAPAGSCRGGGGGRTAHRILRLRRRVLHHRRRTLGLVRLSKLNIFTNTNSAR